MKVSIRIQKFGRFATLELTAAYEDGDGAENFVKTDSSHRKTDSTVFCSDASTLELAILDAADAIRAEKLRERAKKV